MSTSPLHIREFVFFFYPNDREPIYVHIQYQDKSAKIQMEPEISVIENNGLKAQIVSKALEAAEFYKSDIIAEWHKTFDK